MWGANAFEDMVLSKGPQLQLIYLEIPACSKLFGNSRPLRATGKTQDMQAQSLAADGFPGWAQQMGPPAAKERVKLQEPVCSPSESLHNLLFLPFPSPPPPKIISASSHPFISVPSLACLVIGMLMRSADFQGSGA